MGLRVSSADSEESRDDQNNIDSRFLKMLLLHFQRKGRKILIFFFSFSVPRKKAKCIDHGWCHL